MDSLLKRRFDLQAIYKFGEDRRPSTKPCCTLPSNSTFVNFNNHLNTKAGLIREPVIPNFIRVQLNELIGEFKPVSRPARSKVVPTSMKHT